MKRSKTNAAASAVGISEFPDHIVCDILSRLPLDSIFTCKRVCKTWRDLTLEPYFAKLHLPRSPLSLVSYHNGNDDDNINSSPSSHFEILQLHDPPFSGHHNPTVKIKTDIDFPRMRIRLVASCNGLILLSDDNYDLAIVCNPLRGHHFILPEPPNLVDYVGFGFVHSTATDQYKVLRFTHALGTATLYCDIFTIGIGGEWRRIVDTGQPPAIPYSDFVFLNSALHWIGLENSRVICYFDIEKEQFGSFPLPSQFGKGIIYLDVVDNRLYINHNRPFGVRKFWAMKDYGDFESWTLEWVIDEPFTDICTGTCEATENVERWNPVDHAH